MARLFDLDAARLGDALVRAVARSALVGHKHVADTLRLLRGHHHARRRVHPRRVHQADAGDRRKVVRGELEAAAAITYRLAQYLAPQAQE
jgi:hypothetical protein